MMPPTYHQLPQSVDVQQLEKETSEFKETTAETLEDELDRLEYEVSFDTPTKGYINKIRRISMLKIVLKR